MSTPSLVGRDAELARLRRAAASAAAGAGGLLLVTGEAGIGKTSLIDAALRGIRPSLAWAWGTCREGSGVPGLWPWAEVLRSCQEAGLVAEAEEPAAVALGALAAFGEREAADADESLERFRVFDAVGRTLRRAAADRPLAVVLDDLHWADAGSLRLLRFLAPDLHRSRLLVLGAYRDVEAGAEGALRPLLDGLAARAATLPLRHLDQRQVGELVARLRGERPSGAAVTAIHRRTGGNPFFVQQVTQLGTELSGPPAGVRDVVERRLDRLPRSCVELLEVAAVVGREAGTRLLAHATGRPTAEVVGALDAAVGARVLEPAAGGSVRFAHDLFRETVYAGLDSVTRARLHGRVADALEEVTPPTEPGLAADLARHRVAAAVVGDPAEALPYVRRAAAEASAGLAFEEAAVHLAEGVRLAALAAGAERLGEPDGPNVVGQLMVSLAAMRGDLASVAEGMAAAAESVPPWIAAAAQAMVRLHQGDPAAAVELVRPWAETSLAQSRGWQVLGAAAMLAEVAAGARDEPLCALAERLLRPHAGGLVVTGGAVEVAGPVSFYLGLLAEAAGRPGEALGHLADALAEAERMDARPWVARLHHQLGVTLAERGRAEDRQAAEGHLRAAAEGAERLGLTFYADQARAQLAVVAAPENVFRREGDVWTLGFGGVVVRLPDAKGLRDIARLLAAPGKDLPAAALLGSEASAEVATGSDPVLDETARSAYRRRLADLDEEIGDAEQAVDPERAARARAERDQLVDALSAAYGLGGRARRLGDAAERARKTVTARIRDSLGRIEARHPQLGGHLRASIVTGTACSYRPAEQVRWRL